ncbi:MAG: cupin domain-containing protein [Myxococcales bacterium]|nr:cupin domain-containing protein [Myxococcales bacterium]
MGFEYPHTIDNGRGERLTFVARKRDEKGEYLEVTNEVSPGSGPPMHVHYRQREGLTVVSGRMGYQILGQEPVFCEVGESAEFESGVPHRFWAEGDETLTCKGFIRPPDSIEYFLGSIYRLVRESKDGRPDSFGSAYLLHRYRNEFGVNDIPQFVQRLIFPVIRRIGVLRGKDRQFADAPPPVA